MWGRLSTCFIGAAHLMVPDAWLSYSTRLPRDSTLSPAMHSAL